VVLAADPRHLGSIDAVSGTMLVALGIRIAAEAH
jgi:hypothetical protein